MQYLTNTKIYIICRCHKLFCSGYNVNDMCERISRELSIVNEWFCVNRLSQTLGKAYFILFVYCKSVKHPVIKINNNVIERVKVTQLLGIYVNENLSWTDHISYIGNKLSKRIAILYRIGSIINMDGLRNLYCTLILPYLSYCAMVLGNTYIIPRYHLSL